MGFLISPCVAMIDDKAVLCGERRTGSLYDDEFISKWTE